MCENYYPSEQEIKEIRTYVVKNNLSFTTYWKTIYTPKIKMDKTNKLQCQNCGFICKSKSGLSYHLNKSHNFNKDEYFNKYFPIILDSTNKLQCQICKRIFSSKSMLTLHFKTKHNISKEDYFEKYFYNDKPTLDSTNRLQCQICRKIYVNIKDLGHHLKTHKITTKNYYDKYFKKETEGLCLECGSETSFIDSSEGYRLFCSRQCSGKNEERKLHLKQSVLETFGYDCILKVPEIQEKIKQTLFNSTGYYNAMQNPETQQKLKNKKELLYGDSHFNNRPKAEETSLKKYGVKNFNNRPKAEETCLEKYGVKNYTQTSQFKINYKEYCNNKWGVDNPFQVEEIQEKIRNKKELLYGDPYYVNRAKAKETYFKKTGYENPLKNPKILQQIKEFNLEKYGCEYPFQSEIIQNKSKETCFKNSGYEKPFQNPKMQEKITNYWLKNYGVRHPMQLPEIVKNQLKSSYKTKLYTFKSGRIAHIRGYEPMAIDLILKLGILEDDIIVDTDKNSISIPYFTDKSHYYLPDIQLLNHNILIEVKSLYTYEIEIDSNLAKEKACKDLGFIFTFMILNKNGDILNLNEMNKDVKKLLKL
jgi:hypothetical protein